MPHVHELIDFIVVVYVVNRNRVLLVDHKQLKTWLPVGGHIELNEDPEQALYREIKEECGLDVEIVGNRPAIEDAGTKPLLTPQFMDIHDITDAHKHVGLVYFGRSQSYTLVLAEKEHNAIRWFTANELKDSKFSVRPYIRFYAEQALDKLGSNKL